MTTFLQLLFFILLLTDICAFSYTVSVFKVNLVWVPKFIILSLFILAAAVFLGLNFRDPNFLIQFHEVLRPFFLSNNIELFLVDFALLCLFFIILYTLYFSETFCFVPDTDDSLSIHQIRGDNKIFLGTATKDQPFSKRFMKGEVALEFSGETFNSEIHNITFSKKSLHSAEQNVPIRLKVNPKLFLQSFYSYPEILNLDHYLGSKSYPKHLDNNFGSSICFSVGTSSPVPIRIQAFSVQVENLMSTRSATFPAYEMGNGASPIEGWVELSQGASPFSVYLERKVSVKLGSEPVDYHIHAVGKPGQEYNIRIVAEWLDLRYPEHTYNSLLNDDPLSVVIWWPWERMISEARSIRGVFDDQIYFLSRDLRKLGVADKCTLIAPSSYGAWQNQVRDSGVRVIDSDTVTLEPLEQLLGVDEKSPFGLRFFLIDERFILIERIAGTGEVLEDTKLIEKVALLLDQLIRKV